ncbi:MAG: hypothetical protein RRA94_08480 [Bacteroidota bacterium]|nr:hypothetical protein [Bacteroidota bacterium]
MHEDKILHRGLSCTVCRRFHAPPASKAATAKAATAKAATAKAATAKAATAGE